MLNGIVIREHPSIFAVHFTILWLLFHMSSTVGIQLTRVANLTLIMPSVQCNRWLTQDVLYVCMLCVVRRIILKERSYLLKNRYKVKCSSPKCFSCAKVEMKLKSSHILSVVSQYGRIAFKSLQHIQNSFSFFQFPVGMKFLGVVQTQAHMQLHHARYERD